MSAAPDVKRVWTQDDFEAMGWHDCAVHAIAVEPALPYPGRLLIDLDYIVQWVHPEDRGGYFKFWICPATLVFDAAASFKVEMDLTGYAFEPSLDEIGRSPVDEHGQSTWHLRGHEFSMSVEAAGFTQWLRSAPILSDLQRLSSEVRGPSCFAEHGDW